MSRTTVPVPASLAARATPDLVAAANTILAEAGALVRYGVVEPGAWRLLVDLESGRGLLVCQRCQATLPVPGELAEDFRSEPLVLLRRGVPLPPCSCGDAA